MDRKKYLARRGGGGCVRGHKNLGTQIKMYPTPTTTPTHLIINDSSRKQRFYSFRDEIGQPRSFSAAETAYTLTVSNREDGRVYTVETEIKLLFRNRYDQVLQSYYSICAFLLALLFGIQGATAGWFTAKVEWGLSVDCCFLLVSSMLSLSIARSPNVGL